MFFIACDGKSKVVQCAKNNLEQEIRRTFCLTSEFSIQVFNKDFEEWVDQDIDAISLRAKLRIVKGK